MGNKLSIAVFIHCILATAYQIYELFHRNLLNLYSLAKHTNVRKQDNKMISQGIAHPLVRI